MNKCVKRFAGINEEQDDYKQLHEQFSTRVKLGVREDSANHVKDVKLLRYQDIQVPRWVHQPPGGKNLDEPLIVKVNEAKKEDAKRNKTKIL